MEAVVADIGGTHARFAIARYEQGRLLGLSDQHKLKSGDYPGLSAAWAAYGAHLARALPDRAAIAIAAPMTGAQIRLTNLPWQMERGQLAAELGLRQLVFLNDFGALAHAVQLESDAGFQSLSGPDRPLPSQGTIAIVGPGTGLGVACLLRYPGGYRVIETEAGHIGFAPRNAVEDEILAELREENGRVSAERVLSGPGILPIYRILARRSGKGMPYPDDVGVWSAALQKTDPLAQSALAHFYAIWGAVAGDFALAFGATAVVLEGGLGRRLAPGLPQSGFAKAFTDKGRYSTWMADIPLKMMTRAEPALLGAASALLSST